MILQVSLKVIWAIGTIFGVAAAQSAQPISPPATATGFDYLGSAQDVALPELSGLAFSRRKPGLLWAISDSGNSAELVALDAHRRVIGRVSVEGVINHDWEDLAAFELKGKPYLLIADTGDNLYLRSEVSLILVPEPEASASSVAPERVIRLRYVDGSRDSESVAVDALGRRVLLADKGRHPVGLYELPLDGVDGVRVAQRIGEFPDLVPTPAPRAQSIGDVRGRGTPTAMDVSADGRRLAILTNLSATIFDRAADQSWATALKRPALSQRLPRLSGFEAMALHPLEPFALLANEAAVSHFYRWTLPAAP